MKFALVIMALIFSSGVADAKEISGWPVVMELFTSQGCSSCPPADELLKKFGDDPMLLPLSLHVDYWNYLGWDDKFASETTTDRQRYYASQPGAPGLFTPQMIVDGYISANGASSWEVISAIKKARSEAENIDVKITPGDKNLNINIAGNSGETAVIWEMRFNKKSVTEVKSGENGGRILESINNVIKLKNLGNLPETGFNYNLPFTELEQDGFAIIIQRGGYGKIIGAASYLK